MHPVIAASQENRFLSSSTEIEVAIDGTLSHNHKSIEFTYEWIDITSDTVIGTSSILKTSEYLEGAHSVKLKITDLNGLVAETEPFKFYAAPYSHAPGVFQYVKIKQSSGSASRKILIFIIQSHKNSPMLLEQLD